MSNVLLYYIDLEFLISLGEVKKNEMLLFAKLINLKLLKKSYINKKKKKKEKKFHLVRANRNFKKI